MLELRREPGKARGDGAVYARARGRSKIFGGATERRQGSRAEDNVLQHPQGSTTYPKEHHGHRLALGRLTGQRLTADPCLSLSQAQLNHSCKDWRMKLAAGLSDF